MAQEITIPKGFGAVSTVLAGKQSDEFGAGIQSSYGIIGYRGKVWAIKHQGKETKLMRDDGDGPRGSIEVVLVKASPHLSKIFYKNGYVDGSNAAPDCWSANGITPDASVQNKVSSACANCPMNAYGSRVSEAGKQAKACGDSRRVAVVPMNDLDNEVFGGPMLLRIPAATLKELKGFNDQMASHGYPLYGIATRISFDSNEAYPKFLFNAIRVLKDDEARKVLKLRDDKRTSSVLNEAFEYKPDMDEAPAPIAAASIFEEQAPPPPAPKAAAPKAAPPKAAAPKAAPKPAPVEVMDEEEELGGSAPASFDDMLENII